MFRRSLYIFAAIVFLGLLLTVGYSLLGFNGPHETIATARERYARGEYVGVVADLDLAERSLSLQGDPPKARELLRLRYLAHTALGNWPAALRDLQRLLTETAEPAEQLVLDHVRLLALTDNGEQALSEARAFLADNPDHGRALELAGEACQKIYRAELRAVLAAIELDVGPQSIEAAQADLLSYLYRPQADVEVRQAIESLRQLYATQSRTVAAWPSLMQRVQLLRARIQESLDYFRRSLELDGEPVAAFRLLSLSLEQSERIDDLLLLSECYRRRFDHQYVFEAGAIASWALVARQLHEAAIATGNRWLPRGTAAQLAAENRIGPAVLDLFLASIVAGWRMEDRLAIGALRDDVTALIDAGKPLRFARTMIDGLNNYLRERQEQCERQLKSATRSVLRSTTPHGQQDLLPLILRARIENIRRSDGDDAAITQLYTEWATARPTAVEPLTELAEYQLATGKHSGAMATVRAAQQLAPTDEAVLALRVRAARLLYRDSDQDGEGLLAQCRKRSTVVPEVPDPICYLLCGEAALAARVAKVALACGRAAVDAMPWARAGRLIEARAEMLAGRPEAAARVMRTLVDSAPADDTTLELALATHRAAGLPVSDMLWIALRTVPPDPDIAIDLLRLMQNDDSLAASPLIDALRAQTDLPPPLAVLLAAALARIGDRVTAERLMRSLNLSDSAGELDPRDVAVAIHSLLRQSADEGVDDAALSEQTMRWVLKFGLNTPAAAPVLILAGRDVADTHPSTAYTLITMALSTADPEDRHGRDYALAGDLALRTGQFALAEHHWIAALAFPDGRSAAEPLARLCFAMGRPERAEQVYALATGASDPALAVRCGHIAAAERMLGTEAVTSNRGDLLTNVTIAVIGLPSLTPELPLETDAEREGLLELASILRSEELAELALPRARLLASTSPSASSTLLLAHANSLAGNGKAAARLHAELSAAGLTTLVYWREVATASIRPGYQLAPPVAAGLAAAATAGELKRSPVALAIATMKMADIVAAAGHTELALSYRAEVWLRFREQDDLPAHCRPTLQTAEQLIAVGRQFDAWLILDHIRPTLAGAERIAVVDRMLAIASEIIGGEDPKQAGQRRAVYAAIAEFSNTEATQGSIVDFLLRNGEKFPGMAPDDSRTFELLVDHLAFAGSGRDPSDLVHETVTRLAAGHGLAIALEEIEEVLRAHPLALDLWRERTSLLQRLRRGTEGIADMRSVLSHVTSSAHVLDFVAQAALDFTLAPADIAALDKLPDPLKASPKGKLVRGFVALRGGQPDLAVTLLEQAGNAIPELGAVRLRALALALLQSETEDATERARQTLEQLAKDYPSSSAARYAGNFARQLSPR